jgi:hypothetical protein
MCRLGSTEPKTRVKDSLLCFMMAMKERRRRVGLSESMLDDGIHSLFTPSSVAVGIHVG